MTFRDVDRNPKWSFAKVDAHDHVIEVQEKNPISDLATVGIYMFAAGKLFVDSAIDMIIRRDRVNGEYYTCPVYNYLIRKDKKIGIFNIEQTQMHGLGTPDDLAQYLNRI
jgi:dTDP-glucose pyrophosphorylase